MQIDRTTGRGAAEWALLRALVSAEASPAGKIAQRRPAAFSCSLVAPIKRIDGFAVEPAS